MNSFFINAKGVAAAIAWDWGLLSPGRRSLSCHSPS